VQVDEDNGRAAFLRLAQRQPLPGRRAAYAAAGNYTEMNLSLDAAGSRRVNVAETSANFFSMLGTEVRSDGHSPRMRTWKPRTPWRSSATACGRNVFRRRPTLSRVHHSAERAPVTVIGVAPRPSTIRNGRRCGRPPSFTRSGCQIHRISRECHRAGKGGTTLARAGRMYEAEIAACIPKV